MHPIIKQTRRFLGDIGFFLLGIVPALLTILVVVLLGVPAVIYWYLNKLAAKICRPDLEISETLSHFVSVDNILRAPTLNICVCLTVTGKLDPGTIERSMVNKVLQMKYNGGKYEFDRLKDYPTFFGGIMYWKRESGFDIKKHVRYNDYEIRERGKKFNDNDLIDLLSDMQNKPWTPEQSPWEMIIVNDYTTNDEFDLEDGVTYPELSLLILRIHHCMGDGYGIMKLLTSNFDKWDNLSAYPSFPKQSPCLSILTKIVLPFKFVLDYSKFLILRPPNDSSQWSVKAGPFNRQFSTIMAYGIPVERFKNIKNKYHVGFQAVINSVCSGVVRRLMEDRGQKVPKVFTAFQPIPLPEHPGGLTIHTVAGLIKFPVGELDPVKRLRLSVKHLKAFAMSTLPITIFAFLAWLCKWPSPFLSRYSDGSNTTLGISCMPGPAKSGYLKDHRALGTFFSVGTWRGPCACTITSLSRRGRITFVFNFVSNIYPESRDVMLKKINHYLNEELSLLETAPLEAKQAIKDAESTIV